MAGLRVSLRGETGSGHRSPVGPGGEEAIGRIQVASNPPGGKPGICRSDAGSQGIEAIYPHNNRYYLFVNWEPVAMGWILPIPFE